VKRFVAMFVLTPREQRLVIFVVVALVIGVWIKHYREMKANSGFAPRPESSLAPLASPTPNER